MSVGLLCTSATRCLPLPLLLLVTCCHLDPHRHEICEAVLPASMNTFDDDDQAVYENVDPSQAGPQHQMQPQCQAKAEPAVFTSKTAEQRGRGSRSLVILYVLVGVSLLVSAAACVLILLKLSEGLAKAKSDRDDIRAEAYKIWDAIQKLNASSFPGNWLLNAGNCYYFSTVSQSWSYAKQACKKQGAQMIIIENQQEQEFLANNTNGKQYWIGLNDIDNEGTFKWIDDSSVSYSNWNRGEPNNMYGEEHCVEILKDGKWNDAQCENNYFWICEKK